MAKVIVKNKELINKILDLKISRYNLINDEYLTALDYQFLNELIDNLKKLKEKLIEIEDHHDELLNCGENEYLHLKEEEDIMEEGIFNIKQNIIDMMKTVIVNELYNDKKLII